jgi:alpha-glucosidase
VDVWVWKDWAEVIDPAARRAFLQAVKRAGAVGVKIDNLDRPDSESQASVNLYEAMLQEAAALQLMVNFHGCNKNTGLERTYPNQVTREAVRGLEYNAALGPLGVYLTPHHNTILPFVRFVTGPGDYTPVTFDPRKIGSTTLAHQLATAGVFTSPVLHFADDPKNLLAHPEVLDVLKALPTQWHETRVLPGSAVGELVLLARRSGSRWFVFGLNGNATTAKTLARLDLTFLGTTRYRAILLRDATQTSFARQEVSAMNAHSAVSLTLLPGGGFVGMFTPQVIPNSDHDLREHSSLFP